VNYLTLNIRLFYSTVVPSWGFSVRYREVSAAQPSYILPPPPTVVGAFAYPLARILGLADTAPRELRHGRGYIVSRNMVAFLDATIVASAGVSGNGGLVMHQEPTKLNASMYKGSSEASRIRAEPYTKKFYEEALPRIFPVQAVGATFALSVEVYLTWVVDIDRLLRNLGNQGIKLTEEDIDMAGQQAVLGITRIGSKEGIVAVDPAKSGYEKNPVVKAPGENIKTVQYVLKTCVETQESIPVVDLPSVDYTLRPFYVVSTSASNTVLLPYSIPTPGWFRVKHPCRAYAPRNGYEHLFTGVGL
jgi:CRISPR-associated protein Cas5a/b/c